MESVVDGSVFTGAQETEKKNKVALPLLGKIQQAQRSQADLTAVERFARVHEQQSKSSGSPASSTQQPPAQARYYRNLIPLTKPGAGEQYAFEVDLDVCTGCKACVTACHRMNGLEDGEAWRSVGLLHGGTSSEPVQQTVTTACHHCLDPACMNGCPVGAYEKSSETGIVKHLDDQCIGCQYCMLTCPYEVPQFSERKGIVRKCDMCSDRLAEGEAPACVQACPNEAISIRVVSTQSVLEDAQGDSFLPGAPSPGITAPTTTYKTNKPQPKNLLPADFFSVRPAHTHRPLVIMLVLTQLSVGAFCVQSLSAAFGPLHAWVALGTGLLALAASVLHLGRPQYAFRAFIGLRTSWLSREIIAFGMFAPLAAAYALTLWKPEWFGDIPFAAALLGPELGFAVAGVGLLGVFCSVMLYHVTRRVFWSAGRTAFRFYMTAAVLGIATTVCTTAITAAWTSSEASAAALIRQLGAALMLATAIKLAGDATLFLHLRDKQFGDLKRSAVLMTGELWRWTFFRFAAGAIGGVLVPGALLLSATPTQWPPVVAASAASLVFCLIGEIFERSLFFAAVSAPRMPGTIGSAAR